jgi:TatD DNase family protein
LLLETDAPYLSPHPRRGRRNEPAHVEIIARRLAELLHLTLEEVAALTSRNFQRFLAGS